MRSRSMGSRRREWLIVLAWLATLSGSSVSAENMSSLVIPYVIDEPCDGPSYMKVNTSHVGPENPKLLTEVINFTVFSSWARTGVFGMKIFANDKLLETRQIEMNTTKSKKCGDEVKHVFHVVNYGPSDPEIQGHPQLDILLYVLPSIETESSNFSCHNLSHCVKAEIIYHFAPLPKNVKLISYPAHPTVDQFLNLSCSTKDGSPIVRTYSMHMYDYNNGGELFGALLEHVVFNNAKAGKYRCSAINYPFGHRAEVYSRIIVIRPEVKTSPPPITTTTTVTTKATEKKEQPPGLKLEHLQADTNTTAAPEKGATANAVTTSTTKSSKSESESSKGFTVITGGLNTTTAKSWATRYHPWNQMVVLLLSVPCMIFTDLLSKL